MEHGDNALVPPELYNITYTSKQHGDNMNDNTPPRNQHKPPRRICCCVPESRVVPAYIALADVSSGLASGMSVRFFATFLYENLSFSPVWVQVVYILNSLGQAVLLKAAQRAAARHGKCHVAVAFKLTGVVLMLVMVARYDHLSDDGGGVLVLLDKNHIYYSLKFNDKHISVNFINNTHRLRQ